MLGNSIFNNRGDQGQLLPMGVPINSLSWNLRPILTWQFCVFHAFFNGTLRVDVVVWANSTLDAVGSV